MYGEGKTRGQCVVTAIPTTTNQALAAIQLCADDADLRSWILCALEHNYSLLRSQSSGGVQPNLNLSLVKGIKIPLPPLAEQARIVPRMSADANRIVNKLWSYCNVLRDDGLSYGDYLEQLTYLLFLKMADEQTKAPWKRPSPVPEGYDWPSLNSRDGVALEQHYRLLLEHLGKQPHARAA
jgi:hypothetical protein